MLKFKKMALVDVIKTIIKKMALVDLKIADINSLDEWEPSKRNGKMLDAQYSKLEKLVNELKRQCLKIDFPIFTVLNLLVDNEMPIEEASERIDEWFGIKEPFDVLPVMQLVHVEYNDQRVNYCTSIAPHCNQKDVDEYFEDADDVVFLSQNVECTQEQQARLKVCRIHYPEIGTKWALIDPELNAAVGFAKGQICHPKGGRKGAIAFNKTISIGSIIPMIKLKRFVKNIYTGYLK